MHRDFLLPDYSLEYINGAVDCRVG